MKLKRALISVSDKSGIGPLASILHSNGIEIISTGGTGNCLKDLGIPFITIEQITGNPEAFGGRMKTISFNVASGLLFRRDNSDDLKEAKQLGIIPIDLVVCNLYPFAEAVKKGADWNELIENIDIGGPTMIRAAAKNMDSVMVCTDPAQYAQMIEILEQKKGDFDQKTCREFALEAFRHTANYDAVISAEFEKRLQTTPVTISLSPVSAKKLRYGENPHQNAWVYPDGTASGIASATPLQGKELSYNNLLDSDVALRANYDLEKISSPGTDFAVSLVKHLNPCGLALASTQREALELAWSGDPVSSFGSIICFNHQVDEVSAEFFSDKFIEVIIAPGFSKNAQTIFSKKKSLRLLALPIKLPENEMVVRSVSGGHLVQAEDAVLDQEFQNATGELFSNEALQLAKFGVIAAKHARSNAIVLVHQTGPDMFIAGAGMGNPNRLISTKQAVEKARENGFTEDDFAKMILVSDAFFPFADNIELANEAGIKKIVQPGGSIRDNEVTLACKRHGISMVFTGRRHFRH